jgi:tetratricopeptide (TPR) repeat protein
MEDFKKEILEISSLRETKGKEEETLNKITELLPKLREAGEFKAVAKMYWESHLVWQHIGMSERAKPLEEQMEESIKLGATKMLEFAEKAKTVIESHNFDDMLGGAYRFLGRAATYAQDYTKAQEYYELAISKYNGKNAKSKLEVQGFLAEALIRLEKFQEGLDLGIQTDKEFHNSEIGKNLKDEDYFTWAVWMSGIAPRICMALIDMDALFDEGKMKEWLEDVRHELKNPSGDISWGDNKFEFRLEEIENALAQLTPISS